MKYSLCVCKSIFRPPFDMLSSLASLGKNLSIFNVCKSIFRPSFEMFYDSRSWIRFWVPFVFVISFSNHHLILFGFASMGKNLRIFYVCKSIFMPPFQIFWFIGLGKNMGTFYVCKSIFKPPFEIFWFARLGKNLGAFYVCKSIFRPPFEMFYFCRIGKNCGNSI